MLDRDMRYVIASKRWISDYRIGTDEGMNGYEVARAIRKDPNLSATFLVALSGYSMPEDLVRAHEAGFDRHIAKPATWQELEALLAETPP